MSVPSDACSDAEVPLEPIHGSDLAEVGDFLHAPPQPAAQLRPSGPRRSCPPGRSARPNHGFLLRADDRLVGVQLAFYSEREVDGESSPASATSAPGASSRSTAAHGIRLLRAVLAQRGYHFTDLSPSGNVVPLNRKLGFELLDTETALVPHRPLGRSRGVRAW